MNADILQTVFDLVLAQSQQVVQEGTVIDCANGKIRLYFAILAAWIGDRAEHAALHGIGSKSCPNCEVPCKELGGNPLKMYETRDYIRYREQALRHEPAEVASITKYFQQVGVKIGNNVFAQLEQVNPADLQSPVRSVREKCLALLSCLAKMRTCCQQYSHQRTAWGNCH